jgi:phospholipid/cholesterol/gamma-HCH transport system ATP-binding protein
MKSIHTINTNVVDVNDIIVSYGRHIVLDHVSTTVAPSEIRVILGTSGCGKTTLLKTMVGLITPISGQVRLLGKEIADMDSLESREILKRIGILFQNGALLGSLTVGENIALPLRMHSSLPDDLIGEIVRLKLAQVDLGRASDLYPQELSGGMRKRASLARALALDPPVVFCDEPSAGLDPVTSAGLDDLLLSIRNELGIAIVVVTHELSSIKAIADSVVFMHDGKVYFQGNLDEALKIKDGPLADFFNRRETSKIAGKPASSVFTVENKL